jgi:hypothetical protein
MQGLVRCLIPSPVWNRSRSVEAASGAHQETNRDSILDQRSSQESSRDHIKKPIATRFLDLDQRSSPGHDKEQGNDEDDEHNYYHAIDDDCMEEQEPQDGPHDQKNNHECGPVKTLC